MEVPVNEKTREPQYQRCLDVESIYGRAQLGLMANQIWHDDPKRLGMVLARYKFVAKMFAGMDQVLEVGCGDGFGTRVVKQEVGHVIAVDFDHVLIQSACAYSSCYDLSYVEHDILNGPVIYPVGESTRFNGAYALDVLEHIPRDDEHTFIRHMTLSCGGVLILGTPSLESQIYASEMSRQGHVNCKTAPQLKELLSRYFYNVFIFSMNDEVVHTGFYPMAQYLLALCTGPKIL